MAILLPSKTDTIEVVVSFDTALDMTEEEYELYAETLNKDLLRFKEGEEPTVFVMRKVLSFSQFKKVQNEQAGMSDGKMEVRLGFMLEEVKASLIDIKNPSYVPLDLQVKFERGSDGCASEKLMELLISAGIAQELFKARQVALGTATNGLKKK